jgi:hypothetical protein
MTQEELFDVAEKAGLGFVRHASDKDIEKFQQLAKLIAEHEREACAKLRHKLTPFDLYSRSEMLGVMNKGLDDYQQLIQARGQA